MAENGDEKKEHPEGCSYSVAFKKRESESQGLWRPARNAIAVSGAAKLAKGRTIRQPKRQLIAGSHDAGQTAVIGPIIMVPQR